MKTMVFVSMLALAVSAVGFFHVESRGADSHASPPSEGICVLEPTQGNKVDGTISLLQKSDGVHVAGEVRHLSPGKHGFHIHEFGDLRAPDGSTAGGHYNPDHEQHGGLDAAHHHLGDLGNITANDQGTALVDLMAHGLKTSSIIGRSLVVHAGTDDLHSQPSGDSGPRVAVGVIGYRQAATPSK